MSTENLPWGSSVSHSTLMQRVREDGSTEYMIQLQIPLSDRFDADKRHVGLSRILAAAIQAADEVELMKKDEVKSHLDRYGRTFDRVQVGNPS